MKTLKKTLCLVLAVVMVVGVLIIPAGAADYKDYTDKEDIKHEEAVKVLTYLEIVSGTGSGFDPNGKLNRAAGATMLARMMLTRKGADGLPVSETFDDVESAGYSWAAGAISYGVMNGYIRGHGNGKFDPAGALTGYQLAKMLLVAIGYAEPEKYDGAGYETKVYLDATNAGLFDGLTSFDPTKGMTRDDAAQMMFKAMNWSKVAGTTKAYAAFNATNDQQGTITFDSFIEAYLYVDQHNDDPANVSDQWHVGSVDPKTGAIIGDKYGLVESTYSDPFQRVSKSWQKNGKNVVVLDFAANLEYEGAVRVNTVLSAMGITTPGKQVDFTVYEDGGVADTSTYADQQNQSTNTRSFGHAGSTVQVVIDSETAATVYVINTYAYQLKKANITPAKAATGTDPAVKASVQLPNSTNAAAGTTTAMLTFETADFKENDVVLYNISLGGAAAGTSESVVSAVKAPMLDSGAVVRRAANGTVTINSKNYAASFKAPTTGTTNTALNTIDGTKYVFYGDLQGNIILATDTPSDDDSDTLANYIYVFDFATKPASSTGGSDLFNTGATTNAAQAQAKVVYLDTGVVDVVDVAVVQSSGKWYLMNPNGTANTDLEITDTFATAHPFTSQVGLHAYTVRSDGTYAMSFTAAADNSGSFTGTTLSIKKDQVDTGLTVTSGSKHLLANSKTEVIVATLAQTDGVIVGADIDKYVGVSQFPNNAITVNRATHTGTTLIIDEKDGFATRIVILNNAPDTAEDVSLAVYLGLGGKVLNEEGNGSDQLYRFLIDGEVVEVADGGSFMTDFTGTNNVGNVYSLTVDGGKITAAPSSKTAASSLEDKAIVVAESNYMVIGTDNTYVKLASDCVFVYRTGSSASDYRFSVVTDVDVDAYKVASVYTDGTDDATKDAHLVVLVAKSA